MTKFDPMMYCELCHDRVPLSKLTVFKPKTKPEEGHVRACDMCVAADSTLLETAIHGMRAQ